MNLLIIGGSGHVSGALAKAAVAEGWDVWAVTRGQRPLPKGVRGLVADRHDKAAMKDAIVSVDVTWDGVADCICYELDDVQQDIALFRDRAKHFLLVSTDFVYDPAKRRFPQPEDGPYITTPSGGSTDYGYKKRLCEKELVRADLGGMQWTVFRPCHIYGPTSELGCLPLHGRDKKLIDRMLHHEPLVLVGGGRFLQQPILARDLGDLMLSSVGNETAYGEVYNSAGPDIIESREYYEIIAGILDVDVTIHEVPVQRFVEEHPESAPFMCHRIYDLSKMRNHGLAAPSTSIEEGLTEHVEGLIQRHAES